MKKGIYRSGIEMGAGSIAQIIIIVIMAIVIELNQAEQEKERDWGR
jgi:hypothetical protein